MLFRIDITKLKRSVTTLIVLLITACLISGSFVVPVSAAINQEINYQGKLTDSGGSAVADGAYSVVYKLYTVSSGGSAIWTETQSVTATNGLFSVMLGSVTPLSSVDFNQTLYLGVNVGGDGEMTPRKIIGSVPAAFTADKLDNLDSTDFVLTSTTSLPNLWSLTGLGQIGSSTATSTFLGRLAVAGQSIFSGLLTSYQTITAPNFVATSGTASVLPYASSTALSADTLCLTADACRTTWPTGGAAADWIKQTNFGVLSLTPSTTISIWAKDNIYASSSVIVDNRLGVGTSTPGFTISASGTMAVYNTLANATGLITVTSGTNAIGLSVQALGTGGIGISASGADQGIRGISVGGAGIVGYSTSNAGVFGQSESGNGVYGISGNTNAAGIYGTSYATNGLGIYGQCTSLPCTGLKIDGGQILLQGTTVFATTTIGDTSNYFKFENIVNVGGQTIPTLSGYISGSPFGDTVLATKHSLGIIEDKNLYGSSDDGNPILAFTANDFANTGNLATIAYATSTKILSVTASSTMFSVGVGGDTSLSVGALDIAGSKYPLISGTSVGGSLVTLNNAAYVVEDLTQNSNPLIGLLGADSLSLASISLATSTGVLTIFSTATTTFTNSIGIDLVGGGCYAINGACIAGGSPDLWTYVDPFITQASSSPLLVRDWPYYSLSDSSDSPPGLYVGSSDGSQNAFITYGTSTDVLSFLNASGGYKFDHSVVASSTDPVGVLINAYQNGIGLMSLGQFGNTTVSVAGQISGTVLGALGLYDTDSSPGTGLISGVWATSNTSTTTDANVGVLSKVSSGSGVANIAGVFAHSDDGTTDNADYKAYLGAIYAGNTGVLGYAGGFMAASTTADLNIAVYGSAINNFVGHNYAGYFEGGDLYARENVGIGTTSPLAKLTVAVNSFDLNQRKDIFLISSSTAVATTSLFSVQNTGYSGFSTSSPWRTLSVNGTVGFEGLTLNTGTAAASLCLSSTNEITRNTDNETCLASSIRYKQNVESLDKGLNELLQLRPVSFEYKDPTVPGTHFGFIAEETQAVDPLLTSVDDQNLPNGIRWSHITALLVKSVQQQQAEIDWIASSTPWLSGLNIGDPVDPTQLGFGDKSLINVKAITSASGNWSIDEDGTIIAKTIKAENIFSDQGVMVKDKTSGEWYCMYVDGGNIRTQLGECAGITGQQTTNNNTGGGPTGGTGSGDTGSSTPDDSPAGDDDENPPADTLPPSDSGDSPPPNDDPVPPSDDPPPDSSPAPDVVN